MRQGIGDPAAKLRRMSSILAQRAGACIAFAARVQVGGYGRPARTC